MTTQHTPGPWWVDDDGFIAAGFGDDYKTIAEPRCMESRGNEAEIDANAELIAAAPDILAALQAVADYWEGGDVPADIDTAMRAALKKAKGAQ